MEPDLLDPEILFSCVCNPGVLYTHSPFLGFWGFKDNTPKKWGFKGIAPEKFFWDVCWPTVMQTHGIRLTVVFSHGIFSKRKHFNTVVYGNYRIVNNLSDCVRENVRA